MIFDQKMDFNDFQTLIINAIQTINNPQSSSADRLQAHQALQTLEHSITSLFPSTVRLLDKENQFILRQFGLHLLENLIKYEWKNECFSDQSRIEMRQQILMNIHSNVLDIDLETTFIKECYAKCLTEIAKKDYPQMWPSMIEDSATLCSSGFTQCQIVLSFWARFFEDVIFLQNVEPVARRRDIHNFLIENIEPFFDRSYDLLTRENMPSKLRVTNLQFLSLLMQITPANVFRSKCQSTIAILYRQLMEPHLNLVHAAIQCLGNIVIHKAASKEDNKEIVLNLIAATNLDLLLKSVQIVFNVPLSQEQHECLKIFGAVLQTLGHNLQLIWDEDFDELKYLNGIRFYLDTIFAFLSHPSVSLRFAAASICNSLCKNDNILKSKAFESLPCRLTEAFPVVVRLLGFPSKDEPPHSDYSRLDFDVDILFLNEFCRFREALTSSLRKILKSNHNHAFSMVSQFIYKLPQAHSTITAAEWDAWIRFMTVVVNSVTKSEDFHCTAIKEDSRRMLCIALDISTTCLNDDNADFLLSLLSTLFPFLHHHPDFVVKIVERIFTMSLWPNPDTSEVSRKIRHHAMHEFVHLAIEQTSSLLPFADAILEEMTRRSNDLTLRQKCSLAEGFVVLGNKFTSFEQKKQLLDYLMGPSIAYFVSEDFVRNCLSPEKFAKFIGLCGNASEVLSADNELYKRRKDILGHVTMLTGILNRHSIISNATSEVNIQHPAFDSLKSALTPIFSLARCLNGLYNSQCVRTFDSSFKGYAVLDLIDVEKNLNPSSTITSQYRDDDLRAFDHIKSFVADATEKLHTLIGLIASKCGRQYYNLPEAGIYLSRDVLSSIDNILDQRLRFCIRRCFVPIVSSIETENVAKILPSLNILISHTNSRLLQRWQTIKTRSTDENKLNESDDLSRQEIFLQDSTSTVTRDYLNFLKFALSCNTLNKKTKVKTDADIDENEPDSGDLDDLDDVENIEMADGSSAKSNKQSQGEKIFSLTLKISPLGVEMLDPKNGFVGPLTLSIFNALTWPDTQSSLKAVELAALVFQQFFAAKMLDDPTVEYMFGCAVTALQVHGEHEMWVGRFLAFVCYLHEILWQGFPCIRRVMQELPGIDDRKLKFYENKLKEAETTNIPLALKFRKDVFKRLMSQVIGKNLGQKFRNKVSYSLDIPIFSGAKMKAESENDKHVESICNLFDS